MSRHRPLSSANPHAPVSRAPVSRGAPLPSRGAYGRRSRTWSATGGRVQATTETGTGIRLDTHVTAVPDAVLPTPPGTVYARILAACAQTCAVAELASLLGTPLGVATVLVAELRDEGLVETRAPLDMAGDSPVTYSLLLRLRDRLRAI